MPTGYTHKVVDGTLTEFADFALECARAFGALLELRDDPAAPIPTEIKPSTYAQERLDEATKEYLRLSSLTGEALSAEIAEEYAEEKARRAEYRAKGKETNERLNKMSAAVANWTPPTAAHTRFKEFMLQQLDISRETSCDEEADQFIEPVLPSVDEWLDKRLTRLKKQIKDYAGEQAWENTLAQSRTLWLQQLRASLRSS